MIHSWDLQHPDTTWQIYKIVTTEYYAIYRMVSFSMTLSDLSRSRHGSTSNKKIENSTIHLQRKSYMIYLVLHYLKLPHNLNCIKCPPLFDVEYLTNSTRVHVEQIVHEQPQNSPVSPPEQKSISPFSRIPLPTIRPNNI